MSDNDMSRQAMKELRDTRGELGETIQESFNININIKDFSKKNKEGKEDK